MPDNQIVSSVSFPTGQSKPVKHLRGLAFFLAAAALGLNVQPTQASEDTGASANSVSIDIAFVTHLDMQLPEQDIFIEREPGSNQVYRVTQGDNDMNAPLFKAARATKHNPFDPAAIGPHEKGEPLNITLGQWLRQSGQGTYTCSNGQASLNMRFNNLIPDGVYTVWYAFLALPPTEPFNGTYDLPLGARDGSESVFVANADGTASVERSFKPCLEMSNEWITSMLAINWHSDGKTYGADPGAFGYNAHVPLFAMLPKRAGLE